MKKKLLAGAVCVAMGLGLLQVLAPSTAMAQWVAAAITSAGGVVNGTIFSTVAANLNSWVQSADARIQLNGVSGNRYLTYNSGVAASYINGDFYVNGQISSGGGNIAGASNFNILTNGTGQFGMPWTNSATIGAVTINKAMGCGNIAAGASSVVITNSAVSTSDVVFATLQQNDTTALYIRSVIPTASTITIHTSAVASANTKVCFVAFQGY